MTTILPLHYNILSYDPAQGEKPEDFPAERCKDLLRLALGMPEIEIEIKSILPWECAVRVADSFQHGRVFLAGDAAHQMPPWGGQGANTGVQDVHNLAWKLAAVLKGQAAPALLATYDHERRPVGSAAAEMSAQRAGERGILVIKPISPIMMGIFSNRLVRKVMGKAIWKGTARLIGYGYQYCSAAIIPEQRKNAPEQLDGHPGSRAPHIWVEYQGQRLSTLDLFGTGFVLLAGPDGAAWCEAAHTLAARRKIELAAYRVGPAGDLLAAEGRWPAEAGIARHGALLVRPDGFVAWRAGAQTGELEHVLQRILGC